MWSVGGVLCDEFRRQIFEAPRRISGKLSEPIDWSFLKRGREHHSALSVVYKVICVLKTFRCSSRSVEPS